MRYNSEIHIHKGENEAHVCRATETDAKSGAENFEVHSVRWRTLPRRYLRSGPQKLHALDHLVP